MRESADDPKDFGPCVDPIELVSQYRRARTIMRLFEHGPNGFAQRLRRRLVGCEIYPGTGPCVTGFDSSDAPPRNTRTLISSSALSSRTTGAAERAIAVKVCRTIAMYGAGPETEVVRLCSAVGGRRYRFPEGPEGYGHSFMFTGLKVATVLAMIGAVVGEYFGGALNALGVQILTRSRVAQYQEAWAGILMACLLGIGLYLAVAAIERLTLRWVPSTSD